MRSASLSPALPFWSGMLSADEWSDCDIDMFSEGEDDIKLIELLIKAVLWEEEFGWSAGFFVTLEIFGVAASKRSIESQFCVVLDEDEGGLPDGSRVSVGSEAISESLFSDLELPTSCILPLEGAAPVPGDLSGGVTSESVLPLSDTGGLTFPETGPMLLE